MEKRFSDSAIEAKTPVTLVQEFCAKKGCTPVYTLIHDGTGSHRPFYIYRISGLGKTATGEGKSKREAKHNAAEEFLSLVDETFRKFNDSIKNPYSDKLKENVIGALQEFCQIIRIDLPKYEYLEPKGPANARIFYTKCTVASIVTEAEGLSKQQSKHIAAHQMLQKLKELNDEGKLDSLSKVKQFDEETKQKKAIEMLCEHLTKELVIPQIKSKKDPFSYDDFFKQEIFLTSQILNEIKGRKKDYFKQIDPVDKFQKLMFQIGQEWEKSFIPLKKGLEGSMLCIQIKTLRNATFFGWGKDEISAFKAVTQSALEWFSIMSL